MYNIYNIIYMYMYMYIMYFKCMYMYMFMCMCTVVPLLQSISCSKYMTASAIMLS